MRWILDLEFANDSVKSNYKEFMFVAVPVAILLTLTGTIKFKESIPVILGKVLATTVIAAFVVFLMIASVFSDMCTWTNNEILFEHKTDPNTKIIQREFGCGAVDGGPPTEGIYKVEYLTKYFIRPSLVDTSNINRNEWVMID